MNKMLKAMTIWVLLNSLLIYLLILGVVFEVQGAINVIYFIFILTLVLSLFSSSGAGVDQLKKTFQDYPGWYFQLNWIFNLGILMFFAWYGWWFIFTIFFISVMFSINSKHKAGLI